jgi:hypothetical protein
VQRVVRHGYRYHLRTAPACYPYVLCGFVLPISLTCGGIRTYLERAYACPSNRS